MKDVKITNLEIKTDARGWLAELIKFPSASKGQVFVSVAKPGIIRGNHYHTRKTEMFCVISGEGLLFLRDRKTGKEMQIRMGKGSMITVSIPPNVAHGIKNVGNDDMYLLAYTDEIFNPNDADTFPMEAAK